MNTKSETISAKKTLKNKFTKIKVVVTGKGPGKEVKNKFAHPHIRTNAENGTFVKAYQGDHMTMLAFDIDESLNTENFVGFTLQYETPGGKKFYIANKLNFTGEDKLTDSVDAPIQKFRWLHVPGSVHQTLNNTEYGMYTYYVTPRYYDPKQNKLITLDEKLTAKVSIQVGEFLDDTVEFGFTRSYVNSQAYKYRFGENTKIIPGGKWLFDTGEEFTTHNGQTYTYEQLYEYLGFTARKKIIELLKEALNDRSITIEMFTYDFNDPDIARACLELAKAGRIRIISDDYVNRTKNKKTGKVAETGHGLPNAPETDFYHEFNKIKTGKADIVRGHFARYQHNKEMIFSRDWKSPYKVLSGSTNFSITGLCVNANHVVVIKDPAIATLYSEVFNACWGQQQMKKFNKSDLSKKPRNFKKKDTEISFTFSPHSGDFADEILKNIAKSITGARHSVLFSVMQMSRSGGAVMPALSNVKENTDIFSFGITDQVDKDKIALYKPGSKRGVLVDAKDLQKVLPPPFNEEPDFNAHKIHHKFVVVDFNTPNGKVYFGSSNLALGGEKQNGDNLICVQNPGITTVFAIEVLRLVDHFQFRAKKINADKQKKPLTLKTSNTWAKPYFDKNDIKFTDRKLFA